MMEGREEPPAGGSRHTGEAQRISEHALIASNARIGENVSIGPFTVVGHEGAEPVVLGEGTVLEDHVLVEPGAVVGARCIIEDHCRIGRGSVIAAGSRVRSGLPRSGHTDSRHAAPSPASISPSEDQPISPHALVAKDVTYGEGVEIDAFAIVGWQNEGPVRIGARTKISPFALIEPDVTIGEDCLIDAYCRVSSGSVIGNRTKLLYGAAVFEKARIGEACIIGGNVADRTVIEDCVTHFGEIAHDYREPGDLEAWDTVETDSPTIKACSVIGQYAVIIGGRTIGPKSYIAAGSVVKVDVPPARFYERGRMIPLSDTRGLVRVRTDGICG